jgi:diaminopimelate decarboxylase
MSFIGYKNGKLHMEGLAVDSIAEKFGTPVYCYSTEQIAENFNAYKKALGGVMPADKFTICYAMKANSNLAVIHLLARLGAGADVVSGGEMYRAFKGGVRAEKMIFSGVGKSDAEITKAVKNNILQINVESESEMNLIAEVAQREGKQPRIAFRVNPDVDAKTHAKITTGTSKNKFGVDIKQAPALYKKAKERGGLIPCGVAVHIGSQLTDLAPYREAYIRVAELVTDLRKQGHTITTVDLGGGIGITYKDEKLINMDDYAALIRDIILPLDVHVVIEPGRSIVGNAGILLTKVLHIKQGADKKFIIVDAAMNDLMRPSLYDAYHPIIPCNEASSATPKTPCEIVGPICESTDSFLTDPEFPQVAQGEVLAIMVSGAYGAAMSNNYNSRPLAPEVLVSDDQSDLIRKPQKIEDVVANDIIPDWLA